MIHALRYEVARLRTIRSTWWLTGLALFLGVGIALLMSWAINHEIGQGNDIPQEEVRELGPMLVTQLAATGGVPSLVSYLVAIIGIFAWGHEYRHGMIRASLTALSSRTAFWVAKYAVVGLWAAVVSVVTMLLSLLVSLALLSELSDSILTSDTFAMIGRATLYAVLLTWLAMAFTSITRSQAFALVFLFLWPLLIENLVTLFLLVVPGLDDLVDLTRFLPFNAGESLLSILREPTSTFGDPLSVLGGGIVFGATTAVLMVASLLLFGKRDA